MGKENPDVWAKLEPLIAVSALPIGCIATAALVVWITNDPHGVSADAAFQGVCTILGAGLGFGAVAWQVQKNATLLREQMRRDQESATGRYCVKLIYELRAAQTYLRAQADALRNKPDGFLKFYIVDVGADPEPPNFMELVGLPFATRLTDMRLSLQQVNAFLQANTSAPLGIANAWASKLDALAETCVELIEMMEASDFGEPKA